jgi:DNA-binding CsgD family transcriptional regulator
LIGRLLLELETVRDSQFAVPVYQAAASYALWRDDLVDAGRAAERGWNRVHDTEDWVLVARMAATRLEVLAAVAADAHERRDLAAVADSRATSASVVASAERSVRAAGVDAAIGSRQLADAHLAAARAFRARIERRDAAAAWDELARRWARLGDRYQVARSRWRQAEAALTAGDGRAGRAAARRPLVEAATIAADLGARPLLRAVEALASRALIRLPTSVGHELVPVMDARPAVADEGRAGIVDRPLDGNGHAPSSDGAGSSLVRQLVGDPQERRPQTFGLSPREREVLVLIADGRTNREIGERLFISQKTVGVHVGNILAKLDVSGRVEAAAVAIRLGLTDDG